MMYRSAVPMLSQAWDPADGAYDISVTLDPCMFSRRSENCAVFPRMRSTTCCFWYMMYDAPIILTHNQTVCLLNAVVASLCLWNTVAYEDNIAHRAASLKRSIWVESLT